MSNKDLEHEREAKYKLEHRVEDLELNRTDGADSLCKNQSVNSNFDIAYMYSGISLISFVVNSAISCKEMGRRAATQVGCSFKSSLS